MRIADLPFPENPRGNVDFKSGYAHTLRAIGQALETLDLGDFSMEPAGDGYHVTGASMTKYPGLVRRMGSERGARDPSVRMTPIDLNYTPGDVRRLEREGQTQRVETHGMTDTSRLSQALRAMGFYLSQKHSRMVRLSRRGESYEVIYESSSATAIVNTLQRPISTIFGYGFIFKGPPAAPSLFERAG